LDGEALTSATQTDAEREPGLSNLYISAATIDIINSVSRDSYKDVFKVFPVYIKINFFHIKSFKIHTKTDFPR